MWSVVHTRPNLFYSVRVLSRYAHNSSEIHCNLVKRVLRYVIEIMNVELIFRKNESDHLIDYNDSDFVELKDTRHSTEAYIFTLAEEVISHSSKRQSIIALSSCEIEYMTLFEVDKVLRLPRRRAKSRV